MSFEIKIDSRTFYSDLGDAPEDVQREASRILVWLKKKGPDDPDLPILTNRNDVFKCKCLETHYLQWIVERKEEKVLSLLGYSAKLVLVTRLRTRR